jgi:hypothetical protein
VGFDVYSVVLISLEIRADIHFLWLKKLSDLEISRMIDSVYGSNVIWLRIIQKLTHHFEEGGHSLEDEPRPGRPHSTEHVDAIRALLAENLYIS